MHVLNLQQPLKSVSAEVGVFYTVEKGRFSEQVKKLLIVSTHLSWWQLGCRGYCYGGWRRLQVGGGRLISARHNSQPAGWNLCPAVTQQYQTCRLGKPKHGASQAGRTLSPCFYSSLCRRLSKPRNQAAACSASASTCLWQNPHQELPDSGGQRRDTALIQWHQIKAVCRQFEGEVRVLLCPYRGYTRRRIRIAFQY